MQNWVQRPFYSQLGKENLAHILEQLQIFSFRAISCFLKTDFLPFKLLHNAVSYSVSWCSLVWEVDCMILYNTPYYIKSYYITQPILFHIFDLKTLNQGRQNRHSLKLELIPTPTTNLIGGCKQSNNCNPISGHTWLKHLFSYLKYLKAIEKEFVLFHSNGCSVL